MKKGFTLAELLIVLGITGVVAAVLLPAINNLMPDKTKIMYLKAYDELQRDIQSLVSNSSLYPSCLEENNTSIGCSEHPLINTSKPLVTKFQNIEGDAKLCKLLAFTMDAEETCKDESYTYNDSTFKSNLSFTTRNGMQWIVSPQARSIETDKATYQSDIYVDVDPSKRSKNCLYDSVGCKEPDRFKFLVAADGSVVPADPMGVVYVNTRKSYMKSKGQKAEGEVAAILDDELRVFGYRPCGEQVNKQDGESDKKTDTNSENNENQNNNTKPQEDQKPLDACENRSIFLNPEIGTLNVQCIRDHGVSRTVNKFYVPTDATVKDLRNNLQLSCNTYSNCSINTPAAEDITIYFDLSNLRIKYGESNESGKYIFNLHFVNLKYQNDVITYTPPLEEQIYVNWSKPVGKCIIKQGTKECGEFIQLYDPLTDVPERFDNNKLADDHTLAFRVADVQPRYDSTNLYFIKPILSSLIDAIDLAQWIKGSSYTSEFGANSEIIQ